MTKELRRCPFCGGEARYQKITDTMGDVVFVGYIVKCTKCFAAPLPNNYTGDKKKAAERWNKREPMDRIVEQLEKNTCYVEDGDGHAGHFVFTETAIEIVKGGAV